MDVRQLSGTSFRGWSLTKELGRGDSAIVYEASKDGTDAAIKIVFPEALDKHGFWEEKERLELQLQLTGRKQHSNLVEIYGGGRAEELGNTLFLIMERIQGRTLDKVLAEIPRRAIAPLIKQLASAAKFLEDRNLIHRDIKPANIVVNEDFLKLTLLDLGIVKSLVTDDSGRLSGNRFVSTPRYSPPEFVWRTESESIESWRAITFYQIGAILHDLIMRKCLFDGEDQPTARLYDAIKLMSPIIEANDCDQWLVVLAKCCMVKDWRERLRLISWKSFDGPITDAGDIAQKQLEIRIRQIRRDEIETAKETQSAGTSQDKRIQDLWDLQDKVFLETRRFLTGSQIFPRFSTNHTQKNQTKYMMVFQFEESSQLGFQNKLFATITLDAKSDLGQSTEMTVSVTCPDQKYEFEGTWIEVLTVESASAIIQPILLQTADKIVPNT